MKETFSVELKELVREGLIMPEISVFYGIRVTMYYDDHNPPHFHAEYNENNVLIDIIEGRMLKGAFPSKIMP